MAKPTQALIDRLEEQQAQLKKRNKNAKWVVRNWWKLVTLLMAIYVGLPIAAPVLMETGATGPANALYTMYSPMCHQFAFRSTFLFGEETVYPREAAQNGGTTFEDYAVNSDKFKEIYVRRQRNAGFEDYEFNAADLANWTPQLQFSAREFKGDEQMGYKIALCQRDIMIYLTMAMAGILFGFVRHRLRPAPFALYILLGVAPIGLDGFSQLFGYPPFDAIPLLDSWDVRETKPLFRYMTGFLFGFMNVWLAYPYIHRSAKASLQATEEMLAENAKQMERVLKRLNKGTNTNEDDAE